MEGRDSISTNFITDTGSNLHSWTIFGEIDAEILSVTSTQTTVSQGQLGISVDVRIRNNSTRDLRVDTLQLYPRVLPGTNYTYTPVFVTDDTVLASQTRIFNFLVDIDSAAVAGNDTVDARLVATSDFSGTVDTSSHR